MKAAPQFLHTAQRRGFLLIEALLAVAIFALGVLGLGKCISQGLFVERLKFEDVQARRILQNRYEELEAHAVDLKNAVQTLEPPNRGFTLKQTVEPLHKKDELGRDLEKLALVNLLVSWTSAGEAETRSLTFYATVP